jgi:hypothetical protein
MVVLGWPICRDGRFTKPDRKNFFGIAGMLSGLIKGLDNRQT